MSNELDPKFLRLICAVEEAAVNCLVCNGNGCVRRSGKTLDCVNCADIRNVLRTHKPMSQETMNIETPIGDRIVFWHPRNGMSGDVEKGKHFLKIGQVYILASIEVHQSSSAIRLLEVPDQWFNSVQFSNWPIKP